MPEQKVAIVTGASAGIGKSTALGLARLGWHVIGTGRTAARCAEAEAELREAAASSGGKVDFLRGDFCAMADVKRVAAEIMALAPRIDVLINNAGGVRDQRYATPEGLEATFAANHLAPFLLTRELMPLLRASAAGRPAGSVRVIAVASSAHLACPAMNWDDLNFETGFNSNVAYCQAKLANILFTRELDRRVAADGIVAQAMHPGRVDTLFASHGDDAMQSYMANAELDGPELPARTLVWMATQDEAGREGGRYFFNCEAIDTGPQARDAEAEARLWEESERMLARIGF